jgi:hypothetical protein
MTTKQLVADNDRYHQKTGIFPNVKYMKDYYKQFEVGEEEPEKIEDAVEEPKKSELTFEKAKKRATSFLWGGKLEKAKKLAEEWGFDVESLPEAEEYIKKWASKRREHA